MRKQGCQLPKITQCDKIYKNEFYPSKHMYVLTEKSANTFHIKNILDVLNSSFL